MPYTVDTLCQVKNLPKIYEDIFGFKTFGTFVEVGAMDGQTHSNTCGLADLGWSGIYVEPTSKYSEMCRKRHKDNLVTVVQKAISNRTGSLRLHLAASLTTADALTEEAYRKISWSSKCLQNSYETVECTTMDLLLEQEQFPKSFDVLVIDVEGHELEVLEGLSLDIWAPKMIIIEIQDTHEDFLALPNASVFLERFKAIRTRIESAGYRLHSKDFINSIYIK
jgi:FkbM family methyltransferase